MWILRWVLGAILLLCIIAFAIQNTNETATVQFLHWQSTPLPLWVLMFLAFSAGLFVWLAISIFQVLQLKAELRKKSRDNERLQEELNKLRNIAIEDEWGAPSGSA